MAKLSIITINYNDKTGLEKTIKSVIAQSENNFEYIVIDGGSTDGSTDIIEKYKHKITYSISEKDKGIFNAQNKGAQKAKGEYLLFLNSGDTLENTEVIKTFYPQLKDFDLVYGDLLVDNGKNKERANMPDKLDVYYFMISSLAHPVTFISSKLYKELKGYNEELKITGDYEFFLRAVLVNNATYHHIPQTVSVFNTEGISSNPANEEKHKLERKKCWELNFSPASITAFEEYTRVLRSSDLKVGKLIRNIINPFKTR